MNSTDARIEALKTREREDIAAALVMVLNGKNIYQVAMALGRSKEWLRARGIN